MPPTSHKPSVCRVYTDRPDLLLVRAATPRIKQASSALGPGDLGTVSSGVWPSLGGALIEVLVGQGYNKEFILYRKYSVFFCRHDIEAKTGPGRPGKSQACEGGTARPEPRLQHNDKTTRKSRDVQDLVHSLFCILHEEGVVAGSIAISRARHTR